MFWPLCQYGFKTWHILGFLVASYSIVMSWCMTHHIMHITVRLLKVNKTRLSAPLKLLFKICCRFSSLRHNGTLCTFLRPSKHVYFFSPLVNTHFDICVFLKQHVAANIFEYVVLISCLPSIYCVHVGLVIVLVKWKQAIQRPANQNI